MERTARAIIIDDNRLLTLYRRKKINNKIISYYAIPGGHPERDETLKEAATRELKEELNLDITILGYLGEIKVNGVNEYYFHAEIIHGEPILGGEELERNSPDNYYEFKYILLDEIDKYNILSKEYVINAKNKKYSN